MTDVRRPNPLDRLALALSAAASPFVTLPLFLLLLAAHEAASPAQTLHWTLVAAGGMVGAPLLYVLSLWRRGLVTDPHVQRREQRGAPFMAAIAGCAAAAIALAAIEAAPALVLAAGAAALNGLAFGAVTRRWKISMHGSVYLACGLMAGWLVNPWWYLVLLGLPAVVWARVRRGRHNWAQGVAAIALAAGITLVCLTIFTQLGPGR
jgi:hypothetical protein